MVYIPLTIKQYTGGNMKTIKVSDVDMESKIHKGARLDKKIKLLQEQFKGIKEDLSKSKPGKYITEEGHSVTISETPKYTDIQPETAKKALREKRLGKNFMECIKVVIAPLKRYLSDQEIGTLREVDSYTRKYSFK